MTALSEQDRREKDKINASNAILREVRKDAEALLKEHGKDKKVGGITGVVVFVADRIRGISPEKAGTRKVLEVKIPPQEAAFLSERKIALEATGNPDPSIASRIDIAIGTSTHTQGMFSDERIVNPWDGRYIGIDRDGRGTERYTGAIGKSVVDRGYVPVDKARRYQEGVQRAKEVFNARSPRQR